MTEPAAQRRARILTAARQEFGRRGFASARVRDISTATGVTDAMIYRLFPSKQALFADALADSLATLVAQIRALTAEFPTASRAKRYALSRQTQEQVLGLFEDIAPLLGVALFHDSEAGREFYRDMLWPALVDIAEALGGVMTESQRRAIDPQQLVLAMMGMHLAAATARTQSVDAPDRSTPDEAMGEAITESLAYGLTALISDPR